MGERYEAHECNTELLVFLLNTVYNGDNNEIF